MANYNTGGMNLSKLKRAYEAGHSAFKKANNGDIWIDFVQWLNDEPDKYGNTTSFQLRGEKDANEEKVYFGNSKPPQPKPEVQATPVDDSQPLPF